MKKILISIIIILTISAFGNTENKSGSKEINFSESSLKKLLEEAKKSDKIIFVDVSTSWCYYCKLQKRKTFKNKEVARYFNNNFLNISIDAEKGVGEELVNKFGIDAYPTQLFLDKNGKLIYKSVGYRNPKEFIELGEFVNK